MLANNHLIFVITQMGGGGTERFVATICNELVQAGKSVELVALHSADASKGLSWMDAAVPTRELGVPARRAWKKLRDLGAENPDAPILALGPEIAVVLVLLKKTGQIRNPIFYRESTAVRQHNTVFWRFLYRLCVRFCDGIVLQTQSGMRDVRSWLGASTPKIVLPNPCHYLSGESLKVPLKRDGELRLLVMGRMEKMKGQARVIEAFPEICKKFPDASLHLVGEGSLEAELRRQCLDLGVEHAIHFHPFVSDPERWYKTVDILILPSDYEGLPNVVIEAIACGCRVITSDGDGGILEVMETLGLNDYVIPRENFTLKLVEGVECAMKAKPEVWFEAKVRLESYSAPAMIAQRLWSFCVGDKSELLDVK